MTSGGPLNFTHGTDLMDCTDLAEVFREQAEWRRQKAREYPDERNIEAAECFDRLAATATNVEPAVLQAYEELLEDYGDHELQSELLRQVGFHWLPANASEFISRFIRERTNPWSICSKA
ncbi:hypothetical protein ACFLEY_34660 [Bradyrhizobium sp. YCK136]|uniref:hypothetical protein n=1 Tax=Bradyrhizobium sp. YCK136 TaxID=3351346 RepID=UPI0037C96CC4